MRSVALALALALGCAGAPRVEERRVEEKVAEERVVGELHTEEVRAPGQIVTVREILDPRTGAVRARTVRSQIVGEIRIASQLDTSSLRVEHTHVESRSVSVPPPPWWRSMLAKLFGGLTLILILILTLGAIRRMVIRRWPWLPI